FILSYGKGLQVYVTTSYLVADTTTDAYVLHGKSGSFRKGRSDVQEIQLDSGMSPSDPQYGVESGGDEGVLTYFNSNNEKVVEKIAAKNSSFVDFFEVIFQTIRNNKPYPITEEQIVIQLEILEQGFWN